MADHHHHHRHAHAPGSGRTQRQRNEAAVYDARAAQLLTNLTDDELRVDQDRPPFPNREHVDFLSFALHRAGSLEGKRVLEVGCGSGALAVYMALQGADVVAIDVSEEMLLLAKRRAEVNGVSQCTAFIADPVETLGEDSGSYDVVIGNQVLHHLELAEAMSNINRLLARDGVAVFCEPVLFLPEIARRLRNSRAVTRFFPERTDTPDERSTSLRDLQVIRGPFARSEVRPFQIFCRLQNFIDLSDGMFRRLERLDRFLLRRVPPTWRLCRYVVLVLTATGKSEAESGKAAS